MYVPPLGHMCDPPPRLPDSRDFPTFYVLFPDFSWFFSKFFRIFLNFSEFSWIFPNFSEFFRIFRNFSEFFWIFPNFSRIFSLFHTPPLKTYTHPHTQSRHPPLFSETIHTLVHTLKSYTPPSNFSGCVFTPPPQKFCEIMYDRTSVKKNWYGP